ncbi:MAG: hypothetical protein GX549_04060 [Clostridiales bacterium]|nr:hypothetical protein [Clostridiales bacterium]
MYTLTNGILHSDGKPVLALGMSYYPSYHPQKVPVPPEGDRVGEMKKDLREMAEAGFNFVRVAALGDVKLENGQVSTSFPFIDETLREADRVGIATMVRLQGYYFNLRGFENITMLDENDEEMRFHWGWFVRNCLNHEGIIEDNRNATVASARHFDGVPGMVSFQIYNEPAYPNAGFYDYHPETIRAHRRWLVERGYMSGPEAERYEPPRRRPHYDEDPAPWMRWRLFLTERMNDFLNDLSDRAKEGYALPETLTCHMPCPVMPGSAIRGEDYFRVAQSMDILGITHYIGCKGPSFYSAALVLDAAESAAAVYGKHAWLIEYNARTALAPEEWERETYAAIGAGYKGILYYQWRADYPYADGPEPEGFGMVFNNGTRTVKYDRAVAMTALLNRLSPWLACADRLRSGAAILFSEHANAYWDARDNGGAKKTHECAERSTIYTRHIYAALRQAGTSVDVLRACDLAAGALGARAAFVPVLEGLSEDEVADLDAFAASGGAVYVYDAFNQGFRRRQTSGQAALLSAAEALEQAGIEPALRVEADRPCLAVQTVTGTNEGKPYYVACLTNIDSLERPALGARLIIPAGSPIKADKAAVATPEGIVTTAVRAGSEGIVVELPDVTTGAFVVLGLDAAQL